MNKKKKKEKPSLASLSSQRQYFQTSQLPCSEFISAVNNNPTSSDHHPPLNHLPCSQLKPTSRVHPKILCSQPYPSTKLRIRSYLPAHGFVSSSGLIPAPPSWDPNIQVHPLHLVRIFLNFRIISRPQIHRSQASFLPDWVHRHGINSKSLSKQHPIRDSPELHGSRIITFFCILHASGSTPSSSMPSASLSFHSHVKQNRRGGSL